MLLCPDKSQFVNQLQLEFTCEPKVECDLDSQAMDDLENLNPLVDL